MYSIGPYRFTETDARRTVELADEIFDLYADGRSAAVIESLRPPAPTGDLAADLAAVWAAWTAAGPALRPPVNCRTVPREPSPNSACHVVACRSCRSSRPR